MNDDILNESGILITIKKLLGLTEEYKAFDMDIVVHINSVFNILNQMGVGPKDGFIITGYNEKWDEYITEKNKTKLVQLKTYIYQKVRIIFDPPSNGNLLDTLNKLINEFEYRLYTESGGY